MHLNSIYDLDKKVTANLTVAKNVEHETKFFNLVVKRLLHSSPNDLLKKVKIILRNRFSLSVEYLYLKKHNIQSAMC